MKRECQQIPKTIALTIWILGGTIGCEAAMHGQGTVYIWNGTTEKASIRFEGRTPVATVLRAEIGKLYDQEIVAGKYQVTVDDGEPFEMEVLKNEFTIINVRSRGCFARSDVSGLYGSKKTAVKVLEVYAEKSHFQIRDRIGVMPGKRLPATKPKSPFGFQRVAVIPCEIVDDKNEVASYVRRLR